jgi:hypothetical protein
MTIITNLLRSSSLSPQELYQASKSDKKSVSDSFSAPEDVEIQALLNEALEIDESKKTLTIKNFSVVFKIAEAYSGNPNSPLKTKTNLKKYQLYLALIGASHYDLRHNLIALKALRDFYEKNPQYNTATTGGSTCLELINLKLLSNEQLTGSTVVPASRIFPTGESFRNSSHTAQPVDYKPDDSTNSKIAMIKKHEVQPEVAAIEVFIGALMELFIGNDQPTTRQEEKSSNGTVAVLSEKIDFVRYTDKAAFAKWMRANFKGAAELDVAASYIADNDYSATNSGFRKSNLRPVRIDYDQSLCPITTRLMGREKQPKKQIIDDKEYTIPPLFMTDGFAINADDFNNMPLIASKVPRPEIVVDHYVPSKWWANEFRSDPIIYNKIKSLQTNPQYQNAKYRSILEKIILPEILIEHIADLTIFNTDNKQEVVAWLRDRQQKLSAVAIDINGFVEYLERHGASAMDELQQRYENFATKRQDFHLPSKLIIKAFRKNLANLQNRYKNDNLHVDTQPLFSQRINQESQDVNSIISGMLERNAKELQKDYFIGQLRRLTLYDLKKLSKYMQDVQNGLVVDHPFKTIRTERHSRFFSSGNTSSWSIMFHAVKAEIISKLKEAYSEDEQIILESNSYDDYHKLLNHHTGRSYARVGRTSSAAMFEKTFSRAVDNETPTVSRSLRR